MPSYEVAFILRKMANPETAAVLKRAALKIFENKGILFNIENLGERPLPYKIAIHGHNYREGRYFLMKFDSSPTTIAELQAEYRRDVDIIRTGFVKIEPEKAYECTLEEESKPPAYREDVKKMLKVGGQKERRFKPKTGLAYNPFRT